MGDDKVESWIEAILKEIGFVDLSPILQGIVIAFLTLLSEDVTMLTAAMLYHLENLSGPVYWLSTILGIIAGDTFLYGVGRMIAARRTTLFGFCLLRFKEKAITFQKRTFVLLLMSRMMPGTRLPIYVSSGLAQYPLHLYLLSMLISVPVWVIMVTLFGNALVEALKQHVLYGVAMLAVAGLMIFFIQKKLKGRN